MVLGSNGFNYNCNTKHNIANTFSAGRLPKYPYVCIRELLNFDKTWARLCTCKVNESLVARVAYFELSIVSIS